MADPDVDALRTQVADLRRQLDTAQRAAREAEAEAGRARGELAEMNVQLLRARQDQERYQRLFDAGRRAGRLVERVRGRLRRVVRR